MPNPNKSPEHNKNPRLLQPLIEHLDNIRTTTRWRPVYENSLWGDKIKTCWLCFSRNMPSNTIYPLKENYTSQFENRNYSAWLTFSSQSCWFWACCSHWSSEDFLWLLLLYGAGNTRSEGLWLKGWCLGAWGHTLWNDLWGCSIQWRKSYWSYQFNQKLNTVLGINWRGFIWWVNSKNAWPKPNKTSISIKNSGTPNTKHRAFKLSSPNRKEPKNLANIEQETKIKPIFRPSNIIKTSCA